MMHFCVVEVVYFLAIQEHPAGSLVVQQCAALLNVKVYLLRFLKVRIY